MFGAVVRWIGFRHVGVLGAVVSLCYVPGVTGAYIATQWPVLAVLLSFALLRGGPFTIFHAAGLAFVAYAAMRLPFSPAPYGSVFRTGWLVIIMGLSVWFGTVTHKHVRELYAGLAVGASGIVTVSSAPAFRLEHRTDSVARSQRACTSTAFSKGTVLALIAAVALVSERMWIWTIPLAPGIFLADSRGALVALAVGLLGCRVRRFWMLGAIAVVGAFYLLTPGSSSDVQRMFIWTVAWDHLKWLGWGPGVFYTLALFNNCTYSFYPEYAHNDALQFAFEYGLGALLPVRYHLRLCVLSAYGR